MEKLKTQFGKAIITDFWKKEWTFHMPHDFRVHGGEFAIIPKEDYDKLLKAMKSMRNSMKAHPDCKTGSEFEDMVCGCDVALSNIE